ncbi:MAG: hypothetical protein M3R04_03640 [bacterium]|nr:hypothetical protein [bacterium]
MFRAGLIAILSLILIVNASCGGGMSSTRGATYLPVASLDVASSIGADNAQVVLVPSGGSYELRVTGLVDAKAVYGEVSYDPSVLHLTEAQTLSGASAEQGAVSSDGQIVMVVDQPAKSRIVFGMVLGNWPDRSGIDGGLTLARLTFGSGPSQVFRTASKPPGSQNYNAIDLVAAKDVQGRAVLTWLEALAADGGNDGLVSIADLTPLGAQLNKAATDSITRDADYDKNSEVNISDLSAMGAQFDASLGGYKIMASPTPTGTFTEVADIARNVQFPTKPPLGEVTWTWTSPAPLSANTSYKVVPYENLPAKSLGRESDVETLVGAPDLTVVSIDDITYDDPDGVVIDTGTELQIIVTEESVDGISDNVDPFSLENLQLHAIGEVVSDPGNPTDITEEVLWYVTDGGGLADVNNTDGTKGDLTFHDRGSVTITAQKSGDFNVTASITFKLLTIESVDLQGPGASPVAVNSGQDVQFTVIGTFDSDDNAASGNEQTIDITGFANWALLEDNGSGGAFSINTDNLLVNLVTDNATSGDGVRVSAEYPRTDTVLLGDNQKRVSPFFRVDVN